MTDHVPTIEVKEPNRGSRITATVLRADLLIGHAPPLMQRQSVADQSGRSQPPKDDFAEQMPLSSRKLMLFRLITNN